MASHDATSSDFIYDVFLSFRGGTRYGFTGHLYDALRRKGIHTFRDDEELPIGDEIKPTLLEAIEKSRMSMVVLCENYASSTWCLDELVKITECYDNNGKQVLPIFYKVEPSDVGYQKNSYEAAMIKHEKRYGKDSEKVKAWRSALSRVCDLGGEHCSDNMYESELIKKIVEDTSAKLPPMPLEIKHVVGLDSRFEQVKSYIDIDSHDTVCMLGIYGVGGIGKTTFAKDLYNKIRHLFEAASFLQNVREKSNKNSINGLQNLQMTLLLEMGEEIETKIGSTFKGGSEIKHRLGHKRVFLVLDDVDSIKQLESLAGGRDWFGSGSRIIITTRDTSVLDKHVVDNVIIKKYKMEELNYHDSLELFCWHAFNMNRPMENFANISSHAVSYAKGIPLALRVIGSNLKGGSVKEWKIELDKYRKVPDAEIQGVLEISYNSLTKLDQKIFLDIACFFKGETWEYVKRILKACDFFPIIRVFFSKCLITIDENGCLEMHDLLQDMGREIVRKKSPLNVGERSRLWSHEEILQVLKENSGSSTIEGIMLHPPRYEEVDHWVETAFKKMTNLRILIVRNTIFSTGPNYLPNSLRLLDWKGYPSKSFPKDFYPFKIVDFKLPYSSLILQKPFQIFEDLTFINLSQCHSITQIPDVSGAKNLRVLTLDKCHKLVGFDKSIGFMPNLVYLSASECNAFESFVPSMYLPSLEVLSFNFCKGLKHFPRVMQNMDKPLKIRMINTAIKEFPKCISKLIGLEYMDMSICRELQDLSNSLLLLPKLDTLKLDGCSQLGGSFKRFKESHSVANGGPNLVTLCLSEANLSDEDVYMILKNFPKLEDLNVSHNGFESLPKCIKGSLHLKNLDVSYCKNLTDISELPLNIQKVDARYCLSLTSHASRVLWSKAYKERKKIEVVMPKTKIPGWFDYIWKEDIPLFWSRRKFPVVALAFVFGKIKGNDDTRNLESLELITGMVLDDSHTIGLYLFINGHEICPKHYHYFRVGEDHVLLCDLRALFNYEEWQGLDGCLGDDWKAVQVQCESQLILRRSGVYVYKQETNMEDIQFKLPNPNSSRDYEPSSRLVPKRSLEQRDIRHRMETNEQRKTFAKYILPLLKSVEPLSFIKFSRSWRNAKANISEEASTSVYGASLKQEHEDSSWDVIRVLEMIKEGVPRDVVDPGSEEFQYISQSLEEFLSARVEFYRGKGRQSLDIHMAIILEEAGLGRRYWGFLELKHGDPTYKAMFRRTIQLLWELSNKDEQYEETIAIVLLQCQRPSTEESLEEEEYDDPLLQELIRRIEEDATSFNKSYGKLKASIVQTHYIVSGKFMLEMLVFRVMHNLGMLGYNFVYTPYGKLRVETLTQLGYTQIPIFLVISLVSFFIGHIVGIVRKPKIRNFLVWCWLKLRLNWLYRGAGKIMRMIIIKMAYVVGFGMGFIWRIRNFLVCCGLLYMRKLWLNWLYGGIGMIMRMMGKMGYVVGFVMFFIGTREIRIFLVCCCLLYMQMMWLNWLYGGIGKILRMMGKMVCHFIPNLHW